MRSPILDHEQPGDQPMRVCGYQYRARSCRCLHASSNIRSIAEYIGILAGASA